MARRVTAIAMAVAVLLSGCGDGDGDGDDDDGSAAVDVAAALYPLAEVAERIGGDRADVANLTPPGVEPHDFELSTDRVDVVLDADIVLYVGQGFQPAVEDIADRTSGDALDLLEGVDLLAGAADADGDPHIWLDPRLMIAIAGRVRDALVTADPDGERTYQRNADAYVSELEALDAELERGLADCERRAIVTAHAAFGYLAARYGLTQDAITGISPESEPNPSRIAQLADDVRADGVTTIFYEELIPADLAETLAREAGVTTDVLNPIEGLSDEQLEAGATYASVMRENLVALRKALGCT